MDAVLVLGIVRQVGRHTQFVSASERNVHELRDLVQHVHWLRQEARVHDVQDPAGGKEGRTRIMRSTPSAIRSSQRGPRRRGRWRSMTTVYRRGPG